MIKYFFFMAFAWQCTGVQCGMVSYAFNTMNQIGNYNRKFITENEQTFWTTIQIQWPEYSWFRQLFQFDHSHMRSINNLLICDVPLEPSIQMFDRILCRGCTIEWIIFAFHPSNWSFNCFHHNFWILNWIKPMAITEMIMVKFMTLYTLFQYLILVIFIWWKEARKFNTSKCIIGKKSECVHFSTILFWPIKTKFVGYWQSSVFICAVVEY